VNIELDWQAADDDGVWEPVATVERIHGRTWQRRAWYVGFAILLLLAAGCALLTAQRYDRARDGIAFQIQSVIDLETQAFAQGNIDLFLASRTERCRPGTSTAQHALQSVSEPRVPRRRRPVPRSSSTSRRAEWPEARHRRSTRSACAAT